MSDEKKQAGAAKGDFIAPPDIENEEQDERPDALPAQEDFYRPPVRFGSVPVEKEPLGWDRGRGFRKVFPSVRLPFQVVDRIRFGHSELEPNRLIWGDNLHIMRQLPGESIDLIYIDPPFFSGRQYNVIFGDQNELRSFSDIWEDGMPGYLIWLNARLFEMKRLLKKTGSIIVHLDEHAVHYCKIEMDKVFGHSAFVNEIIWHYTGGGRAKRYFSNKHDSLLWYAPAGKNGKFFFDVESVRVPYKETSGYARGGITSQAGKTYMPNPKGTPVDDVWDIPIINPLSSERIGYPTQKPESLLERIINGCSPKGGIVADFFSGGGTTATVAQRLNRRWIACDQSRVAVAVTADRLTRQVEKKSGGVFPVPDFTMEHWGIYETQQLSKTPPEHFRNFILRAFGAIEENNEKGIHGYKSAVPIWIGKPAQESAATAADVQAFANAIRKTARYEQDNLRDGIMLAWAFRPDAREAADELREREQTDVNFIRMDMTRIDSHDFRRHVSSLSTKHADYEKFLTFVQPPKVEVGFRRISPLVYEFDVSDTVIMNAGAKIANVQWDFSYDERFISTPAYSFSGSDKKGEITLQTQHQFLARGKIRIACKVQDDMGGEGFWQDEVDIK